MKKSLKFLTLLLFLIIPGISALAELAAAQLPTITLMGKTFYCYESEKGESLAGIANKFGWNPEVLMKVNSDVITPLDKGTMLFYPAEKRIVKGGKSATEVAIGAYPLHHKVSRGETVYGIAKQYGLSQEDIFAANPSARDGIRAGETLVINPLDGEKVINEVADENDSDNTSSGSYYSNADDKSDPEATAPSQQTAASADGIIYYTVGDQDTLYGIARKFNTSIEELYKQNPGIGADDPAPGETLRVLADSKAADTHVEKVMEKQLRSLTSYKVHRGDTWRSISEKKGVPVGTLKEANPGKTKLKRGDLIVIPDVATVEVEKTFVAEDPRESSEEGRRELYNEVHSIDASASQSGDRNEVNVAIVLDDTDSNKDMEFARGAILAAGRLKSHPFRTNLTIIDGKKDMETVISDLNVFSPSLIVTTAERSLPGYLKDYARMKEIELLNAFDVKDDGYIDNARMLQYLAPTSYFNDEIAQYFSKNYSDYKVIIAGTMEASDALGESIIKAILSGESDNVQEVEIESLPDLELEQGNYLIYGTPAKKEDVSLLLEKSSVLRDRNPLAQVRVIGRPSWITFADSKKDLMGNNYVLMPTRFYFNAEESASRAFIDDYKDMYGHTPIKSYPVYSATAYDILTYFIPNIAATEGDFNAPFAPQQTLQSAIDLRRVSNWGGIVNAGVYVIDFSPFGMYNKIQLPHCQ